MNDSVKSKDNHGFADIAFCVALIAVLGLFISLFDRSERREAAEEAAQLLVSSVRAVNLDQVRFEPVPKFVKDRRGFQNKAEDLHGYALFSGVPDMRSTQFYLCGIDMDGQSGVYLFKAVNGRSQDVLLDITDALAEADEGSVLSDACKAHFADRYIRRSDLTGNTGYGEQA